MIAIKEIEFWIMNGKHILSPFIHLHPFTAAMQAPAFQNLFQNVRELADKLRDYGLYRYTNISQPFLGGNTIFVETLGETFKCD